MKKISLAVALAVLGCASFGVVYAGTCATSSSATMTPVKAEKTGDIIDVAVGPNMEQVTTLVAAVKAAGLVETLKGSGPFTVFAPTNEAFAKLPKGTVESLLKPENKEQLVKILTYHVVAAKAEAKDVVKMTSAKSVQGGEIKISVKDGKVMLGNDKAMATVIKTDVQASNGVIHWIDTVLMPE